MPMVNISFSRHGISTDFHVPGEFFDSTEYQKILAFSNKINGLFGDGARGTGRTLREYSLLLASR